MVYLRLYRTSSDKRLTIMIRFLNILSFLCRKISFFIGKDAGGVYAECDVTQKGSREQT